MRAAFSFALGLRILRGKAGTARYLKGAVIGIALSLVPLILVMEVATGMIEGITARLMEIGTFHVRISLPSSTTRDSLERAARRLLQSGEAREVIPVREGIALLFAGGESAGVTLRFVPSDLFSRDEGIRSMVSFSRGSAELEARDVVLLGAALADKLGVEVGQRVTVLTSYGEDGKGPPKMTEMRVGGIFATGYQELEKLYAYAALDASWKIISPRASATQIGVKVKDPFADLGPALQDIRAHAPPEARIFTWKELEYARLKSFQTTKALLLFIMAMIVLVGAVNVSSSVIMIAFERRFEIGILKSVGAGPSGLSLSFLMAGFVTGLLGTAVGVAIGLIAAVNINEIISAIQWGLSGLLRFFSLARAALVPSAPPLKEFTVFNSAFYLTSIPVRIHWVEVFLAAAGTLALSGIASYVPAARAARVRPLEIIRKV